MKLSNESYASLNQCIDQIIARYANMSEQVITDIQFQPVFQNGQLNVFNDEDEQICSIQVPEWRGLNMKTGLKECENTLKRALESKRKQLETMSILKPFSFVMVDMDKETLNDLVLIDDELILVNDELLKDLDKDLDDFLKKLLAD